MASPHVAAVLAARSSLEAFPLDDGPCVVQAVGRYALLSACVQHVDVALGIAQLVAPLVASRGLILVADAYHEQPDPTAEVRLPPRGELAARFHDGDPAVDEALLVHSAWRDAPAQLTILPYLRVDRPQGPGIEWLATGSDDEKGRHVGRVPDALAAALARPMRPVPEALELVTMSVVAEQLTKSGILADVLELPDMIDLRG